MVKGWRWPVRGLSLVELMVGITIGMFIVAAASMLAATQLGENRRLLLETQLQQDLRSAADTITRELRRAGAASSAMLHVASDDAPALPLDLSDITIHSAAHLEFGYHRRSGEIGPWGFRLDNFKILSRVASALPEQELTDPYVMKVTALSITPVDEPDIIIPCPKLCQPGNDDICWPRVKVRRMRVGITAEYANDPRVVRTLNSEVRLRNDDLRFHSSAPGAQACPT